MSKFQLFVVDNRCRCLTATHINDNCSKVFSPSVKIVSVKASGVITNSLIPKPAFSTHLRMLWMIVLVQYRQRQTSPCERQAFHVGL